MTYKYVKVANLDNLTLEVQSSPIASQLKHMTSLADDLSIVFLSELSVSDKSTLDSIVASHSG